MLDISKPTDAALPPLAPAAAPPVSTGDVALPPTNSLAVVSLVSGILSWVLLPVIGAIVAVICGHLARGQIRDSHGREQGDALALTGMVIGYAQLAVTLLVAAMGAMIIGGLIAISAYSS